MKIIKQYRVSVAGSSLKITIPKEFVKDVGLIKGDTLNLTYDQEKKELVVSKRQLVWL